MWGGMSTSRSTRFPSTRSSLRILACFVCLRNLKFVQRRVGPFDSLSFVPQEIRSLRAPFDSSLTMVYDHERGTSRMVEAGGIEPPSEYESRQHLRV